MEHLRAIAASEGRAFYEGEIAERIASVSQRDGGVLRLDDMRDHAPLDTDVMQTDFAGYQVREMPPNGQGIAALIGLGVLEQLQDTDGDPDDPDLYPKGTPACLYISKETDEYEYRKFNCGNYNDREVSL